MNKPDWIDGCSDNQCIVDGPKVGTNGGCSCIDRHMDTLQVNKMRAFVRELKKQNAELEDKIYQLQTFGAQTTAKVNKLEMQLEVSQNKRMELAQALDAIPCTCHEGYKSRDLADPACPRCQWVDEELLPRKEPESTVEKNPYAHLPGFQEVNHGA